MGLLTFTIKPNIPSRLLPLEELAHNLWISWNYEAIMLFMRLDYDAWVASRMNPVRMLGLVSQARLDAAAADDSFLAALDAVYAKFQRYNCRGALVQGRRGSISRLFLHGVRTGCLAARVFRRTGNALRGSPEDFLRPRASPGGRGPLVSPGVLPAVPERWTAFSRSRIPRTTGTTCPSLSAATAKGEPLAITVEMGTEKASAWIWEVKVGKNSLYLLDTNIEANPAPLRLVTASLYGGERETRIQQEVAPRHRRHQGASARWASTPPACT